MKRDIFENQSFLNYISESKRIMPLAMSFDVTNNCNFRCCHCYVKHTFTSEKDMLPFELISRLIMEMADYGVATIYLTGGEPFLRPDFLDIVELAIKYNIDVHIKSNGSLISEEDIIRMRNLEISDIQISIYGMSNKEYQMVTGSKDEHIFDKVMCNVKRMLDNGLDVKLRYIVLKQNYGGCVEFVKMCREMGLKDTQYYHSFDIHPNSGCDMTPLNYAISVKEQKELLHALAKIDKEYVNKLYHFPKKYRKCNVGRNTIHVCSDGNVVPCPGFSISIGNVYRDSFIDIWEKSVKLNELRDLPEEETPCYDCKDNVYCVGNCMGVINNWNKNLSYKEKNYELCAMKHEQIEMFKELLSEGILYFNENGCDECD